MKYLIPAFALFLGMCLTFLGALFKLESWANATEMLLAGVLLQVTGGGYLLYKLLTRKAN
ncbi:MAG: hypothetical protein SFV22_08090 [Saprospiraceae bacterium]|nr:hypothetical protein [Saprospiraceae bacterium]